MKMKKLSGVLCHITSLPTSFGVGDFGPIAYSFIDKLAEANQSYWQILPVANTDDSGCPYATDSAFGCAEFYISPELLVEEYFVDKAHLKKYFLASARVDFKKVKKNKLKLLEIAYLNFSSSEIYEQFLDEEQAWIEDYCVFRALSESRGYNWKKWGTKKLSKLETTRVGFYKFCQYTCFSQLANLKKYSNDKNIKLVGDLPIFVSYNSMDVWKDPKQFILNDNLEMELETGAAPDTFSQTGQKWGTPIYDWNYHKKTKYEWWNERLSFSKRYFDVIRIDHFRGFCATWLSKVSAKDASNGEWYNGPAADFFQQLNDSPEIIAEDLGYITPDVNELRDQFNFPGMRVFQFMIGGENNPHRLSQYVYNSVAYSGTHDCDTIVGWFHSLSHKDRSHVEHEIKLHNPNNWAMLEVLMRTPSRIVLIQVQDLLGLGSEARFNVPGTVQNLNWTWKLSTSEFDRIDWPKLSQLTKDTGRIQASEVCG